MNIPLLHSNVYRRTSITLLFVLLLSHALFSATVSIKSFGAKGDGKTNDHDAFNRAADYINKQKGHTTLLFPAGTYLIGKQSELKNDNAYLGGIDALALTDCEDVNLKASKGVKIKYVDGLKFGAFNPENGLAHISKGAFYNKKYIAQIGSTIQLKHCRKISISGLDINGNSDRLVMGGTWGDTGYQLSHNGIYILDGENISIQNCQIHHMGLDGIMVSNPSGKDNRILLKNCTFDYNGRQGLSWIGGQGLTAINCSFSFTGKGKISSSPGAGVDIESENANISMGQFTRCTFINNTGCGVLADTGPSRDIRFTGCTFWGVTNWSIWIKKPKYSFMNCMIYGSFVHGYLTTDKQEATRFVKCQFEDKPYLNQGPYGAYLAECDGLKMMIFDQCTFTATTKKVMWYNGAGRSENEKALFTNCTVNVKNNNLPTGDFFGIMRNMNLQQVIFNYAFDPAKKYYLGDENNLKQNLKVNKVFK